MTKHSAITRTQATRRPRAQASRFVKGIDLAEIVGMARRQWPIIAVTWALTMMLAVGYLVSATPKYTGVAQILLDVRKNRLLESQQVIGGIQADSGVADSQVEVIRSESVGMLTSRLLKLTDDQDFMNGESGGLIGSTVAALRNLLSFGSGNDADATSPPTQETLERNAALIIQDNLSVRRIGSSYVIEISYISRSATRAAQVANGLAQAYIQNELEARYQSTKRAIDWLQERMQTLRAQSSAADLEVQKFRANNNLVETNRGLIADQQLVDINSQVALARVQTAEAKAKLDRITDVANSDVPDATVAEALRSETVNRLRAQYLDISAREADFSQRFGRDHQATVNLRAQMRELSRAIRQELGRLAQVFRSDYEIARARQDALEGNLNAELGRAAAGGGTVVRLRELEATAQNIRSLTDVFQQRFMEATQQQSFPITDARVITDASEPTEKSSPRTGRILAAALVIGLFFGASGAYARERLDSVMRTAAQAEEAAGIECLGILPMLPAKDPSGRPELDRRRLRADLGNYRHIADAPFSRFAEVIRSVKVAVDLKGIGQSAKIIGIVSAVPNEGKTTVASNLAQLLAHSGSKVLLIDADLRNPSLTRAVVPEARSGLVEILTRKDAETEFWTDPVTGLLLLPAPHRGKVAYTAELVSSANMGTLLTASRNRFDYVVVDLPPMASVVDVRAAAHLMDCFLLVVEWGRTSRAVLREAITQNEQVYAKCLGLVLNKAHAGVLKRLEGYKGYYYSSYYRDN